MAFRDDPNIGNLTFTNADCLFHFQVTVTRCVCVCVAGVGRGGGAIF